MENIQITSKYEYQNKNKGYERTYFFYDEEGKLRWSCDVYGECIKAPTIYKCATEKNKNFKMAAKRKLLNFTYFLEDEQGSRFAAITRKGTGFRWKILGENNQEIARIIDPANRAEAFSRELFTAQPDSYAVVLDKNLIATIQNEKLSKKIPQTPRNIIGKFFEKIIAPVGLTLRLELNHLATFDTRILIAGMTLLQVHDITGVNRQ